MGAGCRVRAQRFEERKATDAQPGASKEGKRNHGHGGRDNGRDSKRSKRDNYTAKLIDNAVKKALSAKAKKDGEN
jgi:hypothetical protein